VNAAVAVVVMVLVVAVAVVVAAVNAIDLILLQFKYCE